MPHRESIACFDAAPAAVFALLRRTSTLVQLAPPEMRLQLESGPDELTRGARLVLRGRRWGMPQRVVSEVTAFEADTLLILEQRQGPFRRWAHAQRLAPLAEGGTRLSERIDFEPPGGMLGLLVTAGRVESELTALLDFRRDKMRELLTVGR